MRYTGWGESVSTSAELGLVGGYYYMTEENTGAYCVLLTCGLTSMVVNSAVSSALLMVVMTCSS